MAKKQSPLILRQTFLLPLFKIVVIDAAFLRLLFFLVSPDLNRQIPSWNSSWILIIILLVIAVTIFLYLSWFNHRYLIGDDQVIKERGVFWRKRLTLRFPSLDKITVKQGFWGKMLGFGTLTILSSETNEKIKLKNINNPLYYSRHIQSSFPGPEAM